jgi:hypothetical protein
MNKASKVTRDPQSDAIGLLQDEILVGGSSPAGVAALPDLLSRASVIINKMLETLRSGQQALQRRAVEKLHHTNEKLHEIKVSEEEVHHCVRRGDYYAIRPMLPELRGNAKEKNALSREFSSAGSVMSLTATATLLRRNRLMVDDRQAGRGEELLR